MRPGRAVCYCGACARDIILVRELVARGHDVQMVPLYTPLRIDGHQKLPLSPIFYGGINVFLQQMSPLMRSLPACVDRLLDNPRLLGWASRFAVSTQAWKLGPMTVSVLSGPHGKQRKELARLVDYLASAPPPNIICITNTLLSGAAPELKARFNCPVVCALQGEDAFVDNMPEPHRSRSRQLIRQNVRAVDVFLAPGRHYAEEMAGFLDVPQTRIKTIHPGIDPDLYENRGPRPRTPFVIGYLSVITPAKGLDLLADAFIALASSQPDVTLRVAGQVLDPPYWKSITRKMRMRACRRASSISERSILAKR